LFFFSGKYLSVFWTEEHYFQVFMVGSWKVMDEGAAKSFAWAHVNDTYAVVELSSASGKLHAPTITRKDIKNLWN
jgi:hypothetical protein